MPHDLSPLDALATCPLCGRASENFEDSILHIWIDHTSFSEICPCGREKGDHEPPVFVNAEYSPFNGRDWPPGGCVTLHLLEFDDPALHLREAVIVREASDELVSLGDLLVARMHEHNPGARDRIYNT